MKKHCIVLPVCTYVKDLQKMVDTLNQTLTAQDAVIKAHILNARTNSPGLRPGVFSGYIFNPN